LKAFYPILNVSGNEIAAAPYKSGVKIIDEITNYAFNVDSIFETASTVINLVAKKEVKKHPTKPKAVICNGYINGAPYSVP